MIRINLLPVRAKRKRNSSLIQLAAMTSTLLVSIGAGVMVQVHFESRAAEQEQLVEKGRVDIANLKRVIGEVNELDKQKQRLIEQLSVIERLEKGKLGPVRVLDELSIHIPKRVWIVSFTEKEGNLILKGTGLENSDISEFVRALQKSKYFDDVRLKFTQSTSKDGVVIYNFEITTKVNYAA